MAKFRVVQIDDCSLAKVARNYYDSIRQLLGDAMTYFQKNVVFVTVAVLVVLCVALGLNFGIQSYNDHIKEQKAEWNKENIRALKALSVIGFLNTAEQTRLDNAGDDVERMRQALLDIHQGRMTLWSDKFRDATVYHQQYKQKKAAEQFKGFSAAFNRIQAWQPISFEAFKSRGGVSTEIPTQEQLEQQRNIEEIWRNRIADNDVRDYVEHARNADRKMTALIWRIKAADVDELNNDTKARNFHAS